MLVAMADRAVLVQMAEQQERLLQVKEVTALHQVLHLDPQQVVVVQVALHLKSQTLWAVQVVLD
jgi:hypothetical protein